MPPLNEAVFSDYRRNGRVREKPYLLGRLKKRPPRGFKNQTKTLPPLPTTRREGRRGEVNSSVNACGTSNSLTHAALQVCGHAHTRVLPYLHACTHTAGRGPSPSVPGQRRRRARAEPLVRARRYCFRAYDHRLLGCVRGGALRCAN